MVSVRQFATLVAAGALVLIPSSGRSRVPESSSPGFERGDPSSLFAQSAAQALMREFNQPGVSFLLLDATTGKLLASRWDHPEVPIPMGSLVKPFTALAYGEHHQFHYPTHTCKGESSGCWRPVGHGTIDLSGAIANSCNSYFRMLTAEMSADEVDPTTRQFGLDNPSTNLRGPALAGLGSGWSVSPLRMARSYLELSRRRDQPGVNDILRGMAGSARYGTGREVGHAMEPATTLVKTGTAACTHDSHSPGDGFVVVLFPAEKPDLLFLVRVHGVPGSKAAGVAGEMLSSVRE